MKYELNKILTWIDEAEVIVIGGASGMSTANGYDYYTHHTPFFQKYFSDFGKIYHEPSCWQLLYHQYQSDEERWAYMARSGCVMLDLPAGQTYLDLYELVKHKPYYIITTNQDAQFAKVFDPERIFTIQGDAHWMQCARRCHDKLYPSEELLHRLNASIADGKLPKELVPRCPVCGGVMEPWVKSFIFQYGSYWEEQAEKYKQFLNANQNKKILFFALGIGRMTPEFIKNPFINMTYSWENSKLILLNKGEPAAPAAIADRTIAMNADILSVLQELVKMKGMGKMSEIYREICMRIKEADAILIGASNGLSITEGLHLFADNTAFDMLFGDMKQKYSLHSILQGMGNQWPSEEEKWCFWSRLIHHYCSKYQPTAVMNDLKAIIGNKDYFIITSNGECHFEMSGFDTNRIFEVEGNWLAMQCTHACHNTLYPTLRLAEKMAQSEQNGKICPELIPKCPCCGGTMQVHLQLDQNFIPNFVQQQKYSAFLEKYHDKRLVILELGIGWRNQLIKAPFMRLAAQEAKATYVTINLGEIYIPENIRSKSFGLDGYLSDILKEIRKEQENETERRNE